MKQKENTIIDNGNGTSTIGIVSKKYGNFDIIVDTNYINIVKDYVWSIAKLRNKFYAVTGIYNKTMRNSKTLYMHALLNGTPPGLVTDHIDNNTLNNCLSNLRSVTIQQNLFNQGRARGFSKLGEGRYRACIMLNKKFVHLGIFKTPQEARQAYLKAKLELHKI